jgi:hypothetical protein
MKNHTKTRKRTLNAVHKALAMIWGSDNSMQRAAVANVVVETMKEMQQEDTTQAFNDMPTPAGPV